MLPYTVGGLETNKRIVGHCNRNNSGANNTYVLYATQGQNYLTIGSGEGYSGPNPQANATADNIITNGGDMRCQATNIPIAGWSSGQTISGVTNNSGRQVSVVASGNGGQTVNASNNTPFIATYDNSIGWSGTIFTNKDGSSTYSFDGCISYTTYAPRNIYYVKNGGSAIFIGGSGGSTATSCFSFSVVLATNDTISIQSDTTSTLSNVAAHRLNITKLNPSVIAVPEKVYAEYYASSNKSTSTTQAIDFDTKITDTHNAVTVGSGWKFTAPRSAYYIVSGITYTASVVGGILSIYKNNIWAKKLWYVYGTYTLTSGSSRTIFLNQGEYVDIRCNNSISMVGGTNNDLALISNITIESIN
jgi:hypothetical protein